MVWLYEGPDARERVLDTSDLSDRAIVLLSRPTPTVTSHIWSALGLPAVCWTPLCLTVPPLCPRLSYRQVPAARMMKPPSERARIYFLLAWFHAVVQERLRYAPLGWSKGYEFNESDLRVACDTLDTWIEATAMVSEVAERSGGELELRRALTLR